MDNEPQPLTADELKRFYEYLREKKIFCKETPFKRKARFWQIEWSKKHDCKLEPDEKEVLLEKNDAEKNGKNFYKNNLDEDVFKIFDAGKDSVSVIGRFPNFSEPLYQNMLRSAHIPFNMFIPLYNDKDNSDFLIKVFNHILDKTIENKEIREKIKIKNILDFKIEHMPKLEDLDGKKPKKEEVYLNDNTSFDAYIEYTSEGKGKCIIGIEIKYTEPCSTYKKPNNRIPRYEAVTDGTRNDGSRTYKDSFKKIEEKLKDKKYNKKYNQLWRNHMLGESILQSKLQKDKDFRDFISITIYPEKNEHISKAIDFGEKFLNDKYRYTSLFFTYEELFDYIEKNCKEEYKDWIEWMIERYIVRDDEIRKICQIK